MCSLYFLANQPGILWCLRSHSPVSSFHVPIGTTVANSANRRLLTNSFCSEVQLQRCNVGLLALVIGTKPLPVPTDLVFISGFGRGRFGSFFPVRRSLPLWFLFMCLAIFPTPVFSNTPRPISLASRPSADFADQTGVRMLPAQFIFVNGDI